MTYRLAVEDLTVDTFDPNTAPLDPVADPNGTAQPIVWTGCDSACTECGTGGVVFVGF